MMNTVLSLKRTLGLGSLALAGLIGAKAVMANSPNGGVQSCDLAAVRAAQITGVPQSVLLAIARVESGRTISGTYGPWPWTINQSGTGAWFSTGAEAVAHVTSALNEGETNIDIGCFQINYRWHGAEFADVATMFDPDENALYAAYYLQKHFARTGDWAGAIGAYHSRREDAAAAYVKKVTALIGDSLPNARVLSLTAAQPPAPRDNRFPLLRSGPGRMPGSLVSTQSTSSVTSLLR